MKFIYSALFVWRLFYMLLLYLYRWTRLKQSSRCWCCSIIQTRHLVMKHHVSSSLWCVTACVVWSSLRHSLFGVTTGLWHTDGWREEGTVWQVVGWGGYSSIWDLDETTVNSWGEGLCEFKFCCVLHLGGYYFAASSVEFYRYHIFSHCEDMDGLDHTQPVADTGLHWFPQKTPFFHSTFP